MLVYQKNHRASLPLPLSEGEWEVPLRPGYLGDTKHGSTLIIYIGRWKIQPSKAYQDIYLSISDIHNQFDGPQPRHGSLKDLMKVFSQRQEGVKIQPFDE